MWSKEADEQLVTTIGDYPCLYEVSHEDYKDIFKKRSSWMEVASCMNISGALKNLYHVNLRNKSLIHVFLDLW